MNKFFLSLLATCSVITGISQDFGAFPSRTKWKQINTDTARIIYTPKAEAEAKRVATVLHQMAAVSNPLGNNLNKVNVILHSNTTLANGFVTLAPFRSEFYLVPGGNIFEFGNLPWQDQLAVHEYRHVQQYNNFNKGLSRGFGLLFGEEGRAIANALSIPDWFFEGDAVYAETVLTPQGRGRMPYFLNGYNSLFKEGRTYNWMKLRNGSLKDYVPNHYQLGYLLVNYGYIKYGPDFWRKVTADASAFKRPLYPFQHAVEKHAGIPFKTFRQEALKHYSHEVSKRRDNQKTRETVTHFYFPQVIGQDSVLYLKASYKAIPAFYIKDKSGEHKIKTRSISSEEWFSYRNGSIAYTAYNTNARWSLVNYSNIILLDIATGREDRITEKGKYFNPDFSPSGEKLVAISITDSIKSDLHLLDRKGAVLKTFAAPDAAFFIQPRFIDESSLVLGLRMPDASLSLQRLDLNTGNYEALLPPTKATVGFPQASGGNIYFVSSVTGNDEVFSIRIRDKKVFQLTVGGTGHYFPNAQKDTLSWSSFTSNGFKINQKALNEFTPVEVNPALWKEPIAPLVVAHEGEATNILATATKNYPTGVYRKSTGLLNFHSWRPTISDPEIGFSLNSDNVLSTFSNELLYRYNINERSHTAGINLAYGGWFPVITAGYDFTFDRHIRLEDKTYTLNQSEARIGYSIPLNFTAGRTIKAINFGSNLVYNNLIPTGASKDLLNDYHTASLQHFLFAAQQVPRARQHIYPKWGYGLYGAYRHRIDDVKGYQGITNAQFFTPGLLKNQSVVISGSFQQTDTSNILFSNRFANSRGYRDYFFSRMWRGSANYHFPLIYPDRGFANLFYLLRVRSNIFYDHTRVFSNTRTASRNLRSVGTELMLDTRWWNTLPISFGVRYSYLLDPEIGGSSRRNRFEFIVPIDLIPD